MNIRLDRNSKTSLIKQIYDEIENRISSEILTPNEKLDSIRLISKSIGVSQMTVVKAFEMLKKDNLIYKIQGKGSFVKENRTKNDRKIKAKVLDSEDWKNRIVDYVVRTGYIERSHFLIEDIWCNLGTAGLHNRFLQTDEIMEMYLKNYKAEDLSKYPPVRGDKKLIGNIKEYLIDKTIDMHDNDIIITTGSQIAINLIAQTFLTHGDVVVVESPTFPGAIDAFKSRGARIVEVAMTSDGIDTDELLLVCEKYPVKILYLMPTFQNPTGISSSLEKNMEMLDLAHEHNFLIVEDDCWSDLYFEKAERPLKGVDEKRRVIYIAGFSKTLGPSYRLSAIVCDRIFSEKLVAMKSILDSGTPLINQKMISSYIGTLEHKRMLVNVRHELKLLLGRVVKKIIETSPSYISFEVPKGGLVLWMNLPYNFDSKLLYYKLLSEHKISLLLGENCYSSL
ncbi:MAG: PLP-dependent aminotransferase family protein, partial [Acidaminobacteraceae bacterium]